MASLGRPVSTPYLVSAAAKPWTVLRKGPPLQHLGCGDANERHRQIILISEGFNLFCYLRQQDIDQTEEVEAGQQINQGFVAIRSALGCRLSAGRKAMGIMRAVAATRCSGVQAGHAAFRRR